MSCTRAVQMATSCCNVYVACSKKVWGIFKLAKKKSVTSSVFLYCYTSGVHDIVMLLGDVLHVSGVHPLISGR